MMDGQLSKGNTLMDRSLSKGQDATALYMDTAPLVTSTSIHPSRSAAVCGQGTGFGAREDVWTREVHKERDPWTNEYTERVYYYNRATGSSQWHLPNDFYESSATLEKGSKTAFPTHAKAMLKVDCVTEVPEKKTLMSQVASSLLNTTGEQAVAELEKDPRNLEKIVAFLPPEISSMLTGKDFSSKCDMTFKSFNAQVSSDEAAAVLTDLCSTLKMPGMIPAGPRVPQCWSLMMDEPDILKLADFEAFARFVVAVRYLEIFMCEDN